MSRLSSNLTIFLKIFIPIFYIVFFGSFLVGSLIVSVHDAPVLANPIFRLSYAAVFLIFIALLYFSFMKLKRVDADKEHVYINNYLKTYRYSWDDVEKVTSRNYGLFRTMRIYFKSKTSIGKKISFLPDTPLIKAFILENPERHALLADE